MDRKCTPMAILLLEWILISIVYCKEIPSEPSNAMEKTYQLPDVTETLKVDVRKWRDVMRVTNRTTGKTSIAVLDFRRSLASAYIEDADDCFLLGGLDSRLPLPVETVQSWEQPETGSDNLMGPEPGSDDTELTYVAASDVPAANTELLAEEIQTLCAGRNVLWLERKHVARTRNRRQLDMSANGGGSIGSRGTVANGDLHVDYTRRSGSTSHTVGGTVGGTYVKPRGYPSMSDSRWEARYGITRHGRRTNYGVDFHVGGGRRGANRAGVRFRIEF